jgi:PAS domain S-box-containing protein
VLESVAEGIVTIDVHGQIESVNPAAERLFGYEPGELLGRDVSVLMPQPDAGRHAHYVQHYVDTGEARVIGVGREVEGLRRDGTRFPLDLTVSEVPLPDRRIFTGILRDATERKQAEQALRDADRKKDAFLAMLGHELRNPLAGVSNGLHLLADAAIAPEVADRTRLIMRQQLRILSRLVDDLLDVSRITRGKIRLKRERVELGELVRQSVEALRPKLDARGHTVDLALPDQPIHLDADPIRLGQVLTNLLHNAIRYTPPGGHIEVTGTRNPGDPPEVEIRFRDNGEGIAPEILPEIFELFAQAPQALDRAKGGLGIGLTLARGLVELHGGTIQAHSAGVGQGSEFVVALPAPPMAPNAPAETPHRPLARPATAARRVLIVDDDRTGSELLARVLERWGFELQVVHDGQSALDAVRLHAPDIILCDLGLPGLDGFEVARRVRSEQSPDLRLFALTGYGQAEDRERALAAGFDDHLTKPVDLAALRIRIEQPNAPASAQVTSPSLA